MASDSERLVATNRKALFANAKFRRLFLARSASVFGNQFTNLALAFGILGLKGTGHASLLGISFAANSVAMVVCLLFGGVLADRHRRDLLIVGSDLASGATLFALAALFATHHATPAALISLMAIQGAVSAVRYPALTGVLPSIVEAGYVQSANAILRLSTNIASVAGPALAALVVSTAGTPAALCIDGAGYLASVLCIVGLGLDRPTPSGDSMIQELRHGWRAFVKHTWVWAIVAGFAFYNACAAGVNSVLAPITMKAHFHGAATWGTILSVGAIGSVLGSVVAIRLRPRRPMVVGIAWCLPGVVFGFGLAVPFPLWSLCLIFGLSAIGFDLFGVAWESALQLHIEPELIGRVSSYDWMGSLIATPIGLAATGLLADHFGVTTMLVAANVVCLVVVVVLLCVPSIIQMTNDTPLLAAEGTPTAGSSA